MPLLIIIYDAYIISFSFESCVIYRKYRVILPEQMRASARFFYTLHMLFK